MQDTYSHPATFSCPSDLYNLAHVPHETLNPTLFGKQAAECQ